MQGDFESNYVEPTPAELDKRQFRVCSDALDIYNIKRRSVGGAMISAKSAARDMDHDQLEDACYMVSGEYVATNTLTEIREAFQAVVGTIVGLDIRRINDEADQEYMATIKAVAKSQRLPAEFERLRLKDEVWEKKYKTVVDEHALDAYTESCQVKSGYDDVEDDEVETTWQADSKGVGGKDVDVDSKTQPQYDESMSEVVNRSKPNPNIEARRNTMKTVTAKTVAKTARAAVAGKAVKKTAKSVAVAEKGPSKLAQAFDIVAANFREANKKRGAKPMTRAATIRHMADTLGISDACAGTYYHNASRRYEAEVGTRPALPREHAATDE